MQKIHLPVTVQLKLKSCLPLMRKAALLVLIFLFCTSKSFATDCQDLEIDFRIENDSALTLGGGTDRFYSNGMELFGKCHTDPESENPATIILKTIHPQASIRKQTVGILIGQKIYTNSDISLQPQEIDTRRDRPYAAWSYLGIQFESFGEHDAYMSHQLTVGCVGPCAHGDNVQTEWHELIGVKPPQGWDLQIEDQPALQYFAEYRLPQHYEWKWFSLQPQFKLSLGTILTDFSIGGQVRAGDVDISDNTQLFFFIHNQIKAILYDATLQGSLFDNDSPHTVDPTRFTLEQGFGVRLEWQNKYQFEYKFIASSTQVEEQDWKIWDHKYGSFQFGMAF